MDFNWCFQAPTSTYRAAWVVTQDVFGFEGTLTSTAFPSSSIIAKPIVVAYQASDQAMLAAATAASTLSTATTTSAPSQQTSAFSPDKGLSGGAIAGITIGAALGGGALIGILIFVLLRFCFGYRRLPTHDVAPPGTAQNMHYKGNDQAEHQQQMQMHNGQLQGGCQQPWQYVRSELSHEPFVSELSSRPVRSELESRNEK